MSDTVYVVDTIDKPPKSYHKHADCRAIERSIRGALPRARSEVDHLEACGECQKRNNRARSEDTRGVVGVCPHCSSSQVEVRNPKNPTSTSDNDCKYWCEDCGLHFNELKTRQREQQSAAGMGSSLASKLAKMDPSDLQGGAD